MKVPLDEISIISAFVSLTSTLPSTISLLQEVISPLREMFSPTVKQLELSSKFAEPPSPYLDIPGISPICRGIAGRINGSLGPLELRLSDLINGFSGGVWYSSLSPMSG